MLRLTILTLKLSNLYKQYFKYKNIYFKTDPELFYLMKNSLVKFFKYLIYFKKNQPKLKFQKSLSESRVKVLCSESHVRTAAELKLTFVQTARNGICG